MVLPNCLKAVATARHTDERLRAVQDRCWALCWHYTGNMLASCGEDRTVKVWRCIDDDITMTLSPAPSIMMASRVVEEDGIGCSSDNNTQQQQKSSANIDYDADSASRDNDVNAIGHHRLRHTADCEEADKDDGHQHHLNKGGMLGSNSCSRNRTTTTAKLGLSCTMRGDQSRSIRSVAFSPCGRLLASACFDGSVVVYEKQQQHHTDGSGTVDNDDFEELHRLEGHENEVKCVAFSPNGEHLATCSRDKSVWVWQMDEAGDFQVTSILQHHTADVKFVLWHPRDELLVSGGYDGSVRFYAFDGEDWCTAQAIKDAHEETVWSAAFEPKLGEHLATVGTDRTIRIWKRRGTPASSSSSDAADGGQWEKVVDHSLQAITRWPLYTVAWTTTTTTTQTTTATTIPSLTAVGTTSILAVGGGDCVVRLFTFLDDQQPQELCCTLALLTALRMDSEVNCVSWRPQRPIVVTAAAWTPAMDDDAVAVNTEDQRRPPQRRDYLLMHYQPQVAVALDSGHIQLLQLTL